MSTTPVLSTDGNLDPSIADARRQGSRRHGLHGERVPGRRSDPKIAEFFAAYKAAYGEEPSSVVAALGYDEVKMLADTHHAGRLDGCDRDHRGHEVHVDFEGITGHVVMDPETRRAKKSVALVKMDGDTFTCLPAPDFPATLPSP